MAEKEKTAKVLVVEDEEILLTGLKEELESGGDTVQSASDGVEGNEQAESFNTELILLDLLMPKMDGMEMLQKLKAHAETRDIPVVILTNLSDYEKISEALS